jgi:hypothetical protein
LAAALRSEKDVQVNLIDGAQGELSVTVNGHVVAKKTGDKMPEKNDVLEAVRHEHASA